MADKEHTEGLSTCLTCIDNINTPVFHGQGSIIMSYSGTVQKETLSLLG